MKLVLLLHTPFSPWIVLLPSHPFFSLNCSTPSHPFFSLNCSTPSHPFFSLNCSTPSPFFSLNCSTPFLSPFSSVTCFTFSPLSCLYKSKLVYLSVVSKLIKIMFLCFPCLLVVLIFRGILAEKKWNFLKLEFKTLLNV